MTEILSTFWRNLRYLVASILLSFSSSYDLQRRKNGFLINLLEKSRDEGNSLHLLEKPLLPRGFHPLVLLLIE